MERQEFTKSVADVVQEYIDNFSRFDKNPMLRVNPELLTVEVENGYGYREDIEYSDEVVEQAAAAEGDASESSTDYQAKQNYDYYQIRSLFTVDANGNGTPSMDAINRVADKYFKR